MDTAKELL